MTILISPEQSRDNYPGGSAMKLSDKYELLKEFIAEKPGHVAFSGGVDSTLVLKAAVDVLDDKV